MLAAAIPPDITIAVTSCGRLDLLQGTLRSFMRFHSGFALVISEDSTDPAIIEQVRQLYPQARILSGPERLGLMGSIDRLYGAIETPYIFHLEDDWAFDGPVDFDLAKRVLDENPKVSVACVRVFAELKRKHQASSTPFGQNYPSVWRMDPLAHPLWYGYSSNPGLLRREFWAHYAPVKRYRHDEWSGIVRQDGWHMAFLTPGVARHIGDDRHVEDPFEPRKKPGWFKRARRTLRGWFSSPQSAQM